ncbi:hypothetical protein GOP47_0022728 [Adiantum capillus-veneris]|uniref:Uncharacterized protein n=1 Tax=Adiantum capillus-veneris TaxID=13818 RepID=A0A9D4U7W6_ADICA|nr:hypothetical protein GOP47_0022728 [Adiantum capillus-veneris]
MGQMPAHPPAHSSTLLQEQEVDSDEDTGKGEGRYTYEGVRSLAFSALGPGDYWPMPWGKTFLGKSPNLGHRAMGEQEHQSCASSIPA